MDNLLATSGNVVGNVDLRTLAKQGSDMGFRYESEMFAPVAAWLRRLRLRVKREFWTPWGTCDVVGASLDPLRIRWRLHLKQKSSLGPLRRIAILSAIPRKADCAGVAKEHLQRTFKELADEHELTAELDQLRRKKFITMSPDGSYQRDDGWMPLHRRIMAVELKIERVDDAISQASSHLAFTNESFVALPDQLAAKLINTGRAEAFRAAGVGLLAVTSEMCSIAIEPQGHERGALPDPVLQAYCVERFWPDVVRGIGA